jgi:putative intracellular protease/amidase
MILAPTGADVRSARALWRTLRRLGVELVAATECHGEVRGERGEPLFPNLLLVEAALADWDAVVVDGGSGALEVAEDQLARELIAGLHARGKPVAALGQGRAVFERAGVQGFAADDSDSLARWLCGQLGLDARQIDRRLRLPGLRAHGWKRAVEQ